MRRYVQYICTIFKDGRVAKYPLKSIIIIVQEYRSYKLHTKFSNILLSRLITQLDKIIVDYHLDLNVIVS